MMTKIEDLMTKRIMPIAEKINNNYFLGALSESFVRLTFIILGIALVAIIGYWPIPTAWGTWLTSTGIMEHVDAVINASTNALALYVSFSFAAAYAKKQQVNSQNAGFLGLLSFLIISPQTIMLTTSQGITEVAKNYSTNPITNEATSKVIEAFPISAFGGQSLLAALLVSFIASWLYIKMTKKGFNPKLPDSIPPMVAESLYPAFSSMVVVGVAFSLRVGFGFTQAGNMLTFLNELVAKPLGLLTSTPIAFILILTLASFLWFFGIHPNVVYGAISPLTYTIILGNITAYKASGGIGTDLPYGNLGIITTMITMGGAGCTLGLILSMVVAKSKRYKAMFKLAVIPELFNINEPLVFGMPMVLNPIFFLPMVFSPLIIGLSAWGLTSFIQVNLNPLIGLMPWTTPKLLSIPLAGGIKYILIFLICLTINTLIYYPFFKIADRQALLDEKNEELQAV